MRCARLPCATVRGRGACVRVQAASSAPFVRVCTKTELAAKGGRIVLDVSGQQVLVQAVGARRSLRPCSNWVLFTLSLSLRHRRRRHQRAELPACGLAPWLTYPPLAPRVRRLLPTRLWRPYSRATSPERRR